MNSVANLNREELLKRAKELEVLLDASKPKPTAKPSHSATSLARSANFARNQFVLSRTEQSPYSGSSGQQKLGTSNRGGPRAPSSHNRVFVRNKNREKQTEKANCDNAKADDANNVGQICITAQSAASPAPHLLRSVDGAALPTTSRTDDNDSSQEKSASSVRDSQNEARDNWLKKHENLVLTIGGDDSSDDDELIRNHHRALHDILHPVKSLISRVHQRKSVVYQSATKLVKINSSSMPKSSVAKEKLKSHTHPARSKFTLSNRDFSEKQSSHSNAAASLQGNRTQVPSNQANGMSGSTSGVKPSSNSPLKVADSVQSSKIASSKTFASEGRTVEPKKTTRLGDHGISTVSGSGFKHVLKRTRFKLLKGVTVSKKISGPHNKVSRKRGTLKTNKKHLQTLLMLRGVPFQSSKGGKALKRINTSLSVKLTPTTSTKATMRTRLQAVGSSITRVASQLVNRSVYKLNKRKKTGKLSTVSSSSVSNTEQKKDCIFFIRFGKCHKGNSCKFQHDPKKVSICTKFLRGTCKAEKCPFSHKVDKDKMPLCSYFQQGLCKATNCPYRHSYFRKDIPHCENFLRGFCEKGQLCPKQHVLVCTNTGCAQDPKICPLFHKKKTKLAEAGSKAAATRKEKRSKKLVIRQKTSLERDEAWPEFVTLSGSDDEVADVQMEMPTRTSENIKRFLERRTRPVWPDHSKGFSADPIDLRNLMRVNGQLRQTIRKARWLRKVRPIEILGEFIPLEGAPRESTAIEQANEIQGTGKRRSWRRKRRSKKFPLRCSEESTDDESVSSSIRTRKERLFETDDDDDFDPAYRTYGEALQRTKRLRTALGSAESVSSYTSPSDSSDDSSLLENRNSFKLLPPNHHDSTASASRRIHAMHDDDEWLLDYLCHCDHAASPLPEPERLDFFGPVYEHWEFRTGDRIRETIDKFRNKSESGTRSAMMTTKYAPKEATKRGLESIDFIPLRDHEEGEILTESDEDVMIASGDDLAVVDMELASDDEGSAMSPEREKGKQFLGDSEDDVDSRNGVEQSLPFVDDISDLEEGEVL